MTRVRDGMELDVWFDVVCPWCYLGHRRLEEARGRLGLDGERIGLRWRAFRLDPRASAEPGDLRRVIEAKYGPGAFDGMTARLGALGAGAGIDFRFDRALRVGTLDAHRLVQWSRATQPGVATPLVERLFHGYFTEGANVADTATLVGYAEEAGLDPDAAAEVLASAGCTDEVRADQAAAVEAGITGVPAVAYNGAVVIPGAHDVDTMEHLLRRLAARVA